MKVQEVIDRVIFDTCGTNKLEVTADKLMSGSADMEVKGIVTTFMATVDVIKQAVELGANMIITHEPTFYTGMDDIEWLERDPVYLAKKKLIEENGIAIWRFHDHMHMGHTDRIYDGLLNDIGWEPFLMKKHPPHTYTIEETTLGELASFFKKRLNMQVIQIIGDPAMKCSKVGILVGGGSLGLGREQMPMELMRDQDLDVMVCGEILEWTLCAYVNDAQMLGMNKAMLVLGHERSEESGMKHMAQWLSPLVSGIPVTFVEAGEPFTYL
ncbi:Nif3-like dinuclear metal center hexameric protein [Marinicrinis lubricantis]|uniref:GTP cyclohydrolase 1 type 2 homolog n=1 Tax=Marinicrinis lubricantis TaxID=2086470 RepID=A0ABW1IKT9_9BACL